MDPVSAAVAFVGFAASLATLAGLALDSLQTLDKFHDKLRNAPENVIRLQHDLKSFEALLSEIKQQQHDGLTALPQHLIQMWTHTASRMQEDLERFKHFLLKFEHKIDNVSIPSKSLRLRVKFFFADGAVEEFQQRLSMHVQFLHTVQSLLSYHKLGSISVTAKRLENFAEKHYEGVCTSLEHIGLSNSEAFDMQQQALVRVHSRLDALQHSLEPVASWFTSQPDRTRHSIKHVYSTVESSQHYLYNLPIGYLHITVTKEHENNTGRKKITSTKVRIMFVPPRLVSNTTFQGLFGVRRTSISSSSELTATLSPISVNQNTALLKAIMTLDVTTLRELFASGQAQPTDHIIYSHGFSQEYKEPMCLIDVILVMFQYIIPCSLRLLPHQAFLDFLLEQGSLASPNVVIAFFKHYDQNWAYDRPEISNGLFSGYFKSLSSSDEDSLDAKIVPVRFLEFSWEENLEEMQSSLLSVLVAGRMGFDAIPYCLDHHGQSWVLENLLLIDRWLIGVLAFTDRGFRKSLKSHLQGFRSEFGTSLHLWREYAFEEYFGIEAVKSQVKVASKDDRANFLKIVVEKSTFAMLEPFLDLGRQLEEACEKINLLGLAASKGYMATVDGLINAGLDGALALPDFLRRSNSISRSEFECAFSKLLGHAPGVQNSFWQVPDPVIAVLRSDLAYTAHPESIKTLLKGRYYNLGSIHGSPRLFPCNSQISEAIENNRPEALALLLEQGVDINAKIGDLFACDRDHFQQVKLCSWLTFAVHHGRPQCVKILLEHGAVLEALDDSGSTAVEIGRRYTSGKHPRPHPFRPSDPGYENISLSIEQDLETLAILEEALTKESKGSDVRLNGDLSLDMTGPRKQGEVLDALLRFNGCFKKRSLHLHIRNLVWHVLTLSYFEFLLMFPAFLLAYTVLLFFEIFSIMSWVTKSLSKLPQAFCIVALAVIIVSASLINSWVLGS